MCLVEAVGDAVVAALLLTVDAEVLEELKKAVAEGGNLLGVPPRTLDRLVGGVFLKGMRLFAPGSILLVAVATFAGDVTRRPNPREAATTTRAKLSHQRNSGRTTLL